MNTASKGPNEIIFCYHTVRKREREKERKKEKERERKKHGALCQGQLKQLLKDGLQAPRKNDLSYLESPLRYYFSTTGEIQIKVLPMNMQL